MITEVEFTATEIALAVDGELTQYKKASLSQIINKPYPLWVKMIAMTGSAAAADWAVKILVAGEEVWRGSNTHTGRALTYPDYYRPAGFVIPPFAGDKLQIIQLDAGGTNSGFFIFETSPLGRR